MFTSALNSALSAVRRLSGPLLFGESRGRGTAPRRCCCRCGWECCTWLPPSSVVGTNLLFGAASTREERPDDMAQALARKPHAERSRQASTERVRTRANAFTLATGQLGAMRRLRDGSDEQIHRRQTWSARPSSPHRQQHARTRSGERSIAAPRRISARHLGRMNPTRNASNQEQTAADCLVAPRSAPTPTRTAQRESAPSKHPGRWSARRVAQRAEDAAKA